jgi:hypothetical protein
LPHRSIPQDRINRSPSTLNGLGHTRQINKWSKNIIGHDDNRTLLDPKVQILFRRRDSQLFSLAY